VQAGGAEKEFEQSVNRNDALHDEWAFALVEQSGHEVGLPLQTAAKQLRAEARSQPAKIGVL
jgi:hypothetical protein